MKKSKIQSGTKLEIQLGEDTQGEFKLRSSFEKQVNESTFLISVPMKDGKKIQPDFMQKLTIRYESGDQSYVAEGYVDDVVKQGIRTFWKIRKSSEIREFFQRSDERYSVQTPVECVKTIWKADDSPESESIPGLTKDISVGGIAVYENGIFEVGEIMEVIFPGKGRRAPVSQDAEVCWLRDTEKGNPYRHIMGLRFVYTDDAQRKKVQKYITAVTKDLKQ